jgi:hypothetical protein
VEYRVASGISIFLSLITTILSSQSHRLSEIERSIWTIHLNIATDVITITSAAVPLVVTAITRTVNLCLLVTLYVPTFIAATFGLISSAASTAEETTGFYQISQWWVRLIAWGVGLLLFLLGLALDGEDDAGAGAGTGARPELELDDI